MLKYLCFYVLISLLEISICYAQGTTLTKPKVIVAPTKPTLEIDKIKDVRSDELTERFNKTSFEFSPDKPKVIVMMHGITGQPSPGKEGVDNSPGTLRFTKNYYPFGVVARLLGVGGMAQGLELSDDPTRPTNTKLVTPNNEVIMSCRSEFETRAIENDNPVHHIYAKFDSDKTFQLGPNLPKRTLLIIPRDGWKEAQTQAVQAVERLTNLLRTLKNDNAQLIFVCHSGGGIVTRMILSNNPTFFETKELRNMVDAIRRRTLFVFTLSTPHDGSEIAEEVDELDRNITRIDQLTDSLNKYTSGSLFPLNLISTIGLKNFPLPSGLKLGDEVARKSIKSMRNMIKKMNTNELNPDKARRPDSTLIPIYAAGGRRFVREFFGNVTQVNGGLPDINDPFDEKQDGNSRKVTETLGLMLSHWAVVHPLLIPTQSGVARSSSWEMTSSLSVAGKQKLDRWRWGWNKNGQLSAPMEKKNGGYPLPIYLVQGQDGEFDSDGFVDIASSTGYFLGHDGTELTEKIEEYFDHTKEWRSDFMGGKMQRGSWYRLYTGPWETENHGSIHRIQNVANTINQEFLQSAGPYVGAGQKSGWIKPIPTN